MRPFITFIGLILVIPGLTLFMANPSDSMNPRFSTPSGSILWTLMGTPYNIGLIQQYGLAIIILGITIAIYGLLATPAEKDNNSSLVL